jgi:hypothetical protein
MSDANHFIIPDKRVADGIGGIWTSSPQIRPAISGTCWFTTQNAGKMVRNTFSVDDLLIVASSRREETKSSTLRLEHVIHDLRAENVQLRNRVDDLVARLASVTGGQEKAAMTYVFFVFNDNSPLLMVFLVTQRLYKHFRGCGKHCKLQNKERQIALNKPAVPVQENKCLQGKMRTCVSRIDFCVHNASLMQKNSHTIEPHGRKESIASEGFTITYGFQQWIW